MLCWMGVKVRDKTSSGGLLNSISSSPPNLAPPLSSSFPQPKAGVELPNLTISRAYGDVCSVSLYCIPPRSSSCKPGVHSTTRIHWLQRTLHHHESKFFCFINLCLFYCSIVAIHFPTVFPVLPNISSKSINPRRSNDWQSKIIQDSKNKWKK